MSIPDIPLLQEINASAPAGYPKLSTFIISAEGQEDIRIAACYKQDYMLPVDGEWLKFEGSQVQFQKPKRDNKGTQSLRFGFAGVSSRAMGYLKKSIDDNKQISIRSIDFIVPNDGSEPFILESSRPIPVKQAAINGEICEFQAETQDAINTAFPRERYTPENARGIKYL